MILRLILGDQLNAEHSWFQHVSSEVTYVMMEMKQETDYTNHHIQKVIGFFLAMRNFAKELESKGHQVIYLSLDDQKNTQNLVQNILLLSKELKADTFQYLLPDEYRIDQQLSNFKTDIISGKHAHLTKCDHFDTEHFFTKRGDFKAFFKGKKTYLMENFYRSMRKKHQYLMSDEQPTGDQWNFDKENRKKLPKGHEVIAPLLFENDASEVLEILQKMKVKTIGNVESKKFIWPVTRSESLELLTFFVDECLPQFGTYEDAMSNQEWSIYHSRLSFAMNIKLLSPKEVLDAAVLKWQENQDLISLAQIEGFVRQILGWREFMRGVYWSEMPTFGELNYFENHRSLPAWFWNGETKMNCLQKSISQSLNKAYAHHIQRLMVIGNFAMLAGISPDELDQWYLGIYIDAIEWVEITNTRGMSQYADGGIVGSKPYAASANYINKMSDYCGKCHYNKDLKVGEKACPFNSLYWNFYDKHSDKFERNPRVGMVYQLLEKINEPDKENILRQAQTYLDNIETL